MEGKRRRWRSSPDSLRGRRFPPSSSTSTSAGYTRLARTEDRYGVSFVDDVTWVAQGRSVHEIRIKLEAAARRAITWGGASGVTFEAGKTEAILFFRNRRHWKDRGQVSIRVGDHRVPFNVKATRWLGVYLDSRLCFAEHARVSARRARTAERRLSSMVARHGVPPLSARHLQEAIVGATMMYGAEVTWRGQKSMSRTFQVGINRIARATLGVLPSTPVAFLQAKGGSVPAVARLDGRQEAFAIRLASRDEPTDGLLKAGTGLGKRLREVTESKGGGREGGVEQVRCSRGLVFPGLIAVPAVRHDKRDRKMVAEAAREDAMAMERDTDTIWTDGSRLEDGKVGVGVAWFEEPDGDTSERTTTRRRDYRTAGQRRNGQKGYLQGVRTMITNRPGWRGGGFRMGGGHEAYDAELAAVVYALVHLHERGQRGRSYTIFTDSVAAMRRIREDAPGPGQEMAIRAIEVADRLVHEGNTVSIRWTPAHVGVEGNERADRAAKDAANLPPLRGTQGRLSLAFLNRRTTERIVDRWNTDTRTRLESRGRRGAFTGPDRRARPRIRPLLTTTGKRVASRYFQLLSGHAMIAPFLRDRWGWTESDSCWWCDGGRQSRDHLFKECKRWEKEIRELWSAVGRISGRRESDDGPFKSRRRFGFHVRQARARPSNTTVRELLSNSRYTEEVLGFLEKTRVGEVKEGVICK